MKQLLTNSRMSTAKLCPQKHNFAYEQRIRPEATSEPLFVGSLVHKGIELLDGGHDIDAVYADIESAFGASLQWPDKLLVYYTVTVLLRGYQWRWQNDGVEVIKSEVEFRLPLVNPETGKPSTLFDFGGKIDKLVKLPDGRLAVQEIKTVGESIADDADYWRLLTIDEQISGYVLAARELGYDVTTAWYDAIRKPEISPRNPTYQLTADQKALLGEGIYFGVLIPSEEVDAALLVKKESPRMFGARLLADIYARPEFYYNRREIPRIQNDLDAYQYDRWYTMQAIRQSQRDARWPRNTRNCLSRYGKCEYFDLCCGGVRVVDAPPSGFVRLDTPNPELKGVSSNGQYTTTAVGSATNGATATESASVAAV